MRNSSRIAIVAVLSLLVYVAVIGSSNSFTGQMFDFTKSSIPGSEQLGDEAGLADETQKNNVVLVTVEATPSYKLPCYGYDRNTTYYWCKLAENGTLYSEAYTSATYTPLTLTSISSGQYPFEIGVREASNRVRTGIKLLGNKLEDAGYDVYRSRHFDKPKVESPRYRNSFNEEVDRSNLHKVLEDEEDPVFYRDHIVLPHDPYNPTVSDQYGESNITYIEKVREGMKSFRNAENFSNINGTFRDYLYNAHDEELRMTDRTEIKSIVDSVKRSGEYENTMIVVTADHGEMFGKSDYYGHKGPFDGAVKIPLVVKYPGQEEARVSEKLVSLVDIYPTVVEEAGLNYSEEVAGIPLQASESHKYVFVQSLGTLTLVKDARKLFTIFKSLNNFDSAYKYFVDRRGGEERFVENLSNSEGMKKYFGEYYSLHSKTSKNVSERNEDVQQRLEELGYIE